MITRDKEGHYIMIKGSIQEEDVTIVNIYAPNTGAPQYIRQTLTNIKGEIDSDTIIVEDFNTPLTPMEKEMATHSSVLAWRIPGMGEPGGLLSMGSHRVGHN